MLEAGTPLVAGPHFRILHKLHIIVNIRNVNVEHMEIVNTSAEGASLGHHAPECALQRRRNDNSAQESE